MNALLRMHSDIVAHKENPLAVPAVVGSWICPERKCGKLTVRRSAETWFTVKRPKKEGENFAATIDKCAVASLSLFGATGQAPHHGAYVVWWPVRVRVIARYLFALRSCRLRFRRLLHLFGCWLSGLFAHWWQGNYDRRLASSIYRQCAELRSSVDCPLRST